MSSIVKYVISSHADRLVGRSPHIFDHTIAKEIMFVHADRSLGREPPIPTPSISDPTVNASILSPHVSRSEGSTPSSPGVSTSKKVLIHSHADRLVGRVPVKSLAEAANLYKFVRAS